jgi:hypothetical protein
VGGFAREALDCIEFMALGSDNLTCEILAARANLLVVRRSHSPKNRLWEKTCEQSGSRVIGESRFESCQDTFERLDEKIAGESGVHSRAYLMEVFLLST